MNSVNMDFCYASIALLLFFHGCVGQDDVSTAPGTEAQASLEVSIDPSYSSMLLDLEDSKTFSCSVVTDSSEKPTMKWLKDGVEITETNPTARVNVLSRGSLVMLRLTQIIDDDGGLYECVASVAGQEASRTVSVEIVKPLKVMSEANQHGVVDTDGTVECDVTGKPTPSVTWRFSNGSDISESGSTRHVIQGSNLLIKNLQFSDQGSYICDILVIKTGSSKMFNIDYLVVDLPKIDLPPTIEPNNPKVGDEVKIHCLATGTPKPTYSFKKDGNVVADDLVDATAGILTIESVKREDEALYLCIASNDGGSDEKSNTLDVKIPPVISDIPDMKEATEKGKMTIECVAEGDPAPQVSWKKLGMETEYTSSQDHPKIIYEDNNDDTAETKIVKSKMEFDGVKASDAGTYVCTATNVVGSINEEVEMGVKYSPHFDVPFKQNSFFGWRGHNANLTCQASGNPNPTMKWKRLVPTSDGEEKWEDIENADPFTVTDLRTDEENKLSSRSLFVFFNSDDDTLYGGYMCWVENVIGISNKTVQLVQATPPSQPEVSVNTPSMSTMVRLSITKPVDNGGQPVQSYKYVYHVDGDASTGDEDTQELAGDSTSVSIRGLKPATTYVIRVTAKNAVGFSSERSLTFTTAEVSAPLKMSMTSKAFSDSATTYLLKWAEPDDGGAPITKFVMRYRQVTLKNPELDADQWEVADDKDDQFTIQEIEGNKARSYELTGLKRDSYYELRLVATNEEGDSHPDIRIFKTSKGSSGSSSASAGLGSGLIIAIIVIVIVIIVVVVIAVLVVKKRKAARAGDAEGGQKEDGKSVPEHEQLIKKDTKVENENEKGDGIEEKKEFEPDQKPDPTPVPADVADDKPKDDDAPTEPTIQITTPDTPEKPENPTA